MRNLDRKLDGDPAFIEYIQGDLMSKESLLRALDGVDTVIATATAAAPTRRGENTRDLHDLGYENLISACSEKNIKRFVLASAYWHSVGEFVPEVLGKKLVEAKLEKVVFQKRIVRPPAFIDIWLPLCGFSQVANRSSTSTAKQSFKFMQFWLTLIKNFSVKYGLLLAPGNGNRDSVFITSKDAAEYLVQASIYQDDDLEVINASGPEFLSWKEVANYIASSVGKSKVNIIPMPATMLAML